MDFLAAVVVVLVFGPPLIIVPAILGLLAIGMFSHDGPRRVRKTLVCPVRGQRISADFLVPVGDDRPSSVLSCTAFINPARVTCAKACRDVAEVHWTPPVGVFARWALTSDRVMGPSGAEGPAPAPVTKVAN
jgi:hypothetical protein